MKSWLLFLLHSWSFLSFFLPLSNKRYYFLTTDLLSLYCHIFLTTTTQLLDDKMKNLDSDVSYKDLQYQIKILVNKLLSRYFLILDIQAQLRIRSSIIKLKIS